MYDRLAEALRKEALEAPGLSPNGYELMREAANFIDDLVSALNHADEQIVSLVEAAEKRRWISVNERLPKTDDLVLVAIHDDSGDTLFDVTNVGFYLDVFPLGIWVVENERCSYVTHWMPLPEPPREEEK